MIRHPLRLLAAAAALALGLGAVALAQSQTTATLRGDTPPTETAAPPPMAQWEEGAGRRVRNYPEQPPTIPHDITGYIVDLNANRCLSCHARSRVEESGAPMVSITHFMDREGQFRAAVTPRRYFCTQCHVSQQEVRPLVENTFVDVDSLLAPRTGE